MTVTTKNWDRIVGNKNQQIQRHYSGKKKNEITKYTLRKEN